MKQSELYDALKAVCSSVAYRQFRTATPTPFICYQFAGSEDLMADNENYVPIPAFEVELYTDDKDPVLEQQLEDALQALGLTWTKEETFVETEKLNEAIYTVQFVQDREEP